MAVEEQSGFVTVAEFLDPAEAQIAKRALEAAGIDAMVEGANANAMVSMVLHARLQVPAADEEGAREILASAGEVEPEEDSAE
jgi:hypothetical protein